MLMENYLRREVWIRKYVGICCYLIGTVTDDGYLQIAWSTGYVGYGVKLGWSEGSYRGTAHYWTDTDPQPLDLFTTRNSTAVHVDRVECKDSEK